MSFLERLKRKSTSTKEQYAFFGALFVTALIGALWVTTLPARFNDVGVTADIPEEEGSESPTFSDLFETAEQFGTVLESTDIPQEVSEFDAIQVLSDPELSTTSEPEHTAETKEETPEPRVVLIATTSTQKAE